jgi:outer membrane protein
VGVLDRSNVLRNRTVGLRYGEKRRMLMRNMLVMLVLCAAVCAAPSVLAGGDVRIGTVDMARLVKAHPDTPGADSALEKQSDEFETEAKEMKGKLDKLQKEVENAISEAQNKALSDTAKDDKKKVAEEKLMAYRESEQKFRETRMQRQKELNDQRLRMQRKIVGKIKDAINTYAAKNGYTIVLDSSSMSVTGVETVLFGAEKLDMTDDIMKLLSKEKTSDKSGGKP